MTPTDLFIQHVKEECKANGIKVILKKRNYLVLSGNMKCGGYFDDENKELVVAIKSPEWLSLLAHEFGHFTQWKDNCEAWSNLGNSLGIMVDWLDGKKVRGIKKALARARDLELDNEKRVVKLIKKWQLPIDIKIYTQKANAYVQFYNWMYYSRRWCSPKNSPYRNPKIYKQMPTIFKMNYEIISEKYIKIFENAGI